MRRSAERRPEMVCALLGLTALTSSAGLASEAGPASRPAMAAVGIGYWDQQRRGANCQNRSVEPAYWEAAAEVGIEFVRLVPDGWQSASRDFLIGDADTFVQLEQRDLATLQRVLDDAQRHGVRVVLTMFSLPGARWKQLNGGEEDRRLWTDAAFHRQAFSFWRQLAAALKDHPAIVAYNPLNEPHPERGAGIHDGQLDQLDRWYTKVRGGPADLNAFNRGVVAAIREVDQTTPIVLDGWLHASTEGLTRLEPVPDRAVLYAFHHYEPWEYVTFRINKGRFAYPARMPAGWTRSSQERAFAAVARWARSKRIPTSRIIAAEFGVDRRVGGARDYLRDTIRQLDSNGWHWAFYAFRGDGAWGGLDYELGSGGLGGRYWAEVERGVDPETLKRRHMNPLWRVIVDALARE